MLEELYRLTSRFGYYSVPNAIFMKIFLAYVEKSWSNRSFDGKSIVLTGMPRGGTTWLGEILTSIPGAVNIHEPLMIGRLPHLEKLKFSSRQVIPEGTNWPEAKEFLQDLTHGRILKPALLVYNEDIPDLPRAEYLVTKFCRLNQMLPWFCDNVNTLKPIYIIRHPCAVVYSQLNHGAFGYDHSKFPHKFKTPDCPFNDVYKRIERYIFPLETEEEVLAAGWCLDTMPIFHSRNNKDWTTVTYEEAILDKEGFVERLFGTLNLEVPEPVYALLDKPSKSTQKENPLKTGSDQLSKWKEQLSSDQINRIMKVVEFFEIKFYTREVEPDYSLIRKENNNRFFNPSKQG